MSDEEKRRQDVNPDDTPLEAVEHELAREKKDFRLERMQEWEKKQKEKKKGDRG